MEYTNKIKRFHLRSSLLLVLFLFLLVSGVLAHIYFKVYQTKKAIVTTQIYGERQYYLENVVSGVIHAIESDVRFCNKNKTNAKNVATDSSVSMSDCDSVYLVRAIKNRIREIKLVDGSYLRVKKVVNYEGGRDYAILLIQNGAEASKETYLSTETEDIKGNKPYQYELAQLRKNGEALFDNSLKMLPAEAVQHRRTYARLNKDLDWIISADIDISKVDVQVNEQVAAIRLDIYQQATKMAFFILILFIVALVIVFLSGQKVGKTVTQYQKRVKGKAKKLNNLNSSLKKEVERQQVLAKESKDTLRSIFRAADNVAFILTGFVDEGQVIVDVSSGVENMLGYKNSELIGQSIAQLYPPEIEDDLCSIHNEGRRLEKGFSGEMTLVKKNGERLPVLYSNQPQYNTADICTGNITVAVDISQLYETRKTLGITEERLQQAQKMEAIGTLAGGIAHDFNNVLSSIVGYTELVREQINPDSQAYLDVEQVLQASTRAANLVKQILAFSRKKNMESSYFEPAIIVKETLKMLRSTIPATIRILDHIEAEGQTIYANSTQFHQVFMNLCTNGYQAMDSDGGILEVHLSRTSLEKLPDNFQLVGEAFLELIVADTGTGIAPEIKERIFEPFFSTKESARGTGMGLSTVSDIVTKSGGVIWFNERAGGGTEFHVVLPVSEDAFVQNGRKDASDPIPQGTESILFVDDEPEITRMAKAMLESIGYTVHSSNKSTEALNLYLKNEQIFDLIITDQTMPEMTGAELARNVRRHSPTIPIILSTGYSARISEENWMRHGINGFIMKPFRKREIARLIRETLGNCQN